MKGQTNFAEMLEDFIMIVFFGMMIWIINSTLVGHEVYVHNIGRSRIAIDLGESILGASCLTEKKGVFLETKLSNFSKMPCLELGNNFKNTIVVVKLKSGSNSWKFSTYKSILALREDLTVSIYYFPALIKDNYGNTFPAILSVEVMGSRYK